MKRLLMAGLVVVMLALGSGTARAGERPYDQYEDSMMHPLRLVYYVAYPVGFAAEWLIGRPFHYLISRPYLDQIFGYRPSSEEASYRQVGEHM
jgi:hypothetical protein